MRLNNLCANGAYSGVYWNDGSFQEFSYVTGADSAEMGQGGMRVNMVPKDGGNSFHGSVYGNYSPSAWASDNCGSSGRRPALHRQEPDRRHHLQQDQQLPHQRQPAHQELRQQHRHRRADHERQDLVLRHVPLSRREQDGGRQLLQPESAGARQVHALRRRHQPARDRRRPHPQPGGAHRRASQLEGQDHLLPRRPGQGPRPLGHCLDDSAGSVSDPGDADQLRVGHQVHADAEQQAAVRRRLRGLRSGVSGELSA